MSGQPWIDGPFAALDFETTGTDPFTARVVAATILTVGAEGLIDEHRWLVNPGVEIPAEASAIHGITTELAQEEGVDAPEAIYEIAQTARSAWAHGLIVVAFNANYDFTVLDAEIDRHHGAEYIQAPGPVFDPLVIDRALDRYRSGKRRLADCCAVYGVDLDGAHSSDGDALAAARLAWRMAHSFEWLASMTLAELHVWQVEQHRLWAEDFSVYLARVGKPAVIEREWPVRRVPVAAKDAP